MFTQSTVYTLTVHIGELSNNIRHSLFEEKKITNFGARQKYLMNRFYTSEASSRTTPHKNTLEPFASDKDNPYPRRNIDGVLCIDLMRAGVYFTVSTDVVFIF